MTTPQDRELPKAGVAKFALLALKEGYTAADAARLVGISRQAVQQALVAESSSYKDIVREYRVDRLRELYQSGLEEMIADAEDCLVCGGPNIRGITSRLVTCSPPCARAYGAARPRVSEDRNHQHRLAMAHTIVRRPEKYRPHQVEWANRMLSANPPPPNRRFIHPDSEATRLLAIAQNGEPS